MPEAPRPEPSRLYRWLVLIFVSLAMFGSYYAYDALSPIADVLKQQLGFTDLDIGFLQAIYSFPNIFTVLIGGFIIDRIGLRKSLMIFAKRGETKALESHFHATDSHLKTARQTRAKREITARHCTPHGSNTLIGGYRVTASGRARRLLRLQPRENR